MPDFAYVARNSSGDKISGSITAASQREAVTLLAGQSLFPLKVTTEQSKTVEWTTNAKDAEGNPMVQKTTITEKSENERVLVLKVPGKKKDEFIKFMQIKFVKRN